MARRVYIIAKGTVIDDVVKGLASGNDCPEIACGIPPALKDKVTEAQLPCVYEELEPVIPDPEPNEVDILKVQVAELQSKMAECALKTEVTELSARVESLETTSAEPK